MERCVLFATSDIMGAKVRGTIVPFLVFIAPKFVCFMILSYLCSDFNNETDIFNSLYDND